MKCDDYFKNFEKEEYRTTAYLPSLAGTEFLIKITIQANALRYYCCKSLEYRDRNLKNVVPIAAKKNKTLRKNIE